MGAWGTNSFDNDTANDWAYGLEDADDLSPVHKAIAAVLKTGPAYLDSDEACEAIAACEVIARLKGHWGKRDAYTDKVDNWVQAHSIEPPDALVRQALQAVDRILAPRSELLELWDENGVNEEWHAAMADLRNRIAGA